MRRKYTREGDKWRMRYVWAPKKRGSRGVRLVTRRSCRGGKKVQEQKRKRSLKKKENKTKEKRTQEKQEEAEDSSDAEHPSRLG